MSRHLRAGRRRWWAEIENCAGIWADFDRVEWYEVGGSSYPCPAYEGRCEGWWQPPHTIYMAQDQTGNRQLAEHEMLHDLLQRGDHPPVFVACGVATQSAW
ncbi:MAG: hypothetical protein E6K55_06325 [Gemmatimonadetes bacterium]|nr:MAG: hypothetical protein E6K55_06325 [Gemmatimonadota bacterium]